MQINSVLSFTPAVNDSGTNSITIELTTSDGEVSQTTTFPSSGSIKLNIKPVADAPTLSPVSGNLGALDFLVQRMLREVLIYLVWYRRLRRVEIL